MDEIGRGNFFQSSAWFLNLARTAFEPDARLRLYGVEEAGPEAKPLLLLVARTPAGQNGSVFRGWWMGRHSLAALTNYQSVEFAPVVSPTIKDASGPLRELAEFLAAERPRWSLVDVNLLDPRSPWLAAFTRELASAGMVVRSYAYAGKWFQPTEGKSFQQYLKTRHNNERRGIWRHRRQLAEEHDLSFEIVTRPEQLERGIAAYDKVFNASWKAAEPFPRYTAELLRAAAGAGVLRLGLLYVDDLPVAAQIWIFTDGQATIYKLCYDEKYRRYSVGSILTAHLMEYVLDVDRAREVNFGLFDEPHKRAWMSEMAELRGLAAFNPRTAGGQGALLRFEAQRGWRGLLRPLLRRVYLAVARRGAAPAAH
jgi:ribosomal protein S18 acetylase RimI-like enzyme